MDPTKELSRLIAECKFEEAFTGALQRSDVSIVSWLCSQVCSALHTPPHIVTLISKLKIASGRLYVLHIELSIFCMQVSFLKSLRTQQMPFSLNMSNICNMGLNIPHQRPTFILMSSE